MTTGSGTRSARTTSSRWSTTASAAAELPRAISARRRRPPCDPGRPVDFPWRASQMQSGPHLTVRVRSAAPGAPPVIDLALGPATTLLELLARVTRDHAIPAGVGWTLRARD